MSCHGSLSEIELVVSRWFCGVGDPCGWGCWHFWLQLAQVDHRTKATAKCSYTTLHYTHHKYTSDLQKPLPKRIFLLRRCLKWWVPPSNSSTAIPEDTRRWGRHIIQYTIYIPQIVTYCLSLSIYSADRWHWQILHPTQFVTHMWET